MNNVAICEKDLMKQTTQVVKMSSGESTRREVSLIDLAWLGGFLTGEGCFGAYLVTERRLDRPDLYGRLAFRVSMVISGAKMEDIIKAKDIVESVGGKAHVTYAKRKDRKFWIANLSVMGQGKLKKLLPLLLPYLSGKRTEAEYLLQIIAYRESIIQAGNNGHDANADPQLRAMIERLKALKDESKMVKPPNDYTPRPKFVQHGATLEERQKRGKLERMVINAFKSESNSQKVALIEQLVG